MLSDVQITRRLRAASGYLDLGMPAEALEELDPIDHATLLPLFYLRAASYRELGEFETAVPLYATILKQQPDNVGAAVMKAWCEKRSGRLQDAIRTLEKSVRLNPREAILQYNLACYHALQDDKQRCLSRLGVAIRLDRSYAALVQDETDFNTMRNDVDFAAMVDLAVSH